jgi:hypothetical protein
MQTAAGSGIGAKMHAYGIMQPFCTAQSIELMQVPARFEA